MSEELRVKREELKPCPFCGMVPEIVVTDDEGNVHPDEYRDDPWSGLGFAIAHYDPAFDCPVALHEGETYPSIYDSEEEAAAAWNRRAEA